MRCSSSPSLVLACAFDTSCVPPSAKHPLVPYGLPVLPYGEVSDLAGISYTLSRSQDSSSSLKSFLKCAALSYSTRLPKLRLAQPLDKAHFSWFGFTCTPRLPRVLALMSSHGSTVTPQNGSLLRARSSSSEPVFISSCFKIGAPYCILYWFQFLVWVITLFLVYLTSADDCHTLHFMNDQLFPSPPVKGSSARPGSSGLYQRASQLSAALSWPPVALCSHQLLLQLQVLSHQSCPTLRPHRRQPTRLPRPWDSPGKNTGVGCHFLLQCMKVKSESEVA